MTVRELIERLSALPDQEAMVITWCAEVNDAVPVTGMLYGGDDGVVELQTDDPTD